VTSKSVMFPTLYCMHQIYGMHYRSTLSSTTKWSLHMLAQLFSFVLHLEKPVNPRY